MIRVLVVTNDFPPRVGGIEEYVSELVRHMAPTATVTVLTSAHAGAANHDADFPARIERWRPFPLLPSPMLASAVVDRVRRDRIEVVMFGATMPLAMIAGSVRRRTGVPIVMMTHGLEPAMAAWPMGAPLLARVLRHAAAVTVLSRWSEQRLRRLMGNRLRIVHLSSGVDPRRFRQDVSGETIRARYRLSTGPVVTSVARLVARKGHDRLIAALPRVARAHPNVRLLIAGDGPYRPVLERAIAAQGVTDRVVLTGLVSYAELPAHFAAGDVFAMPCRSRWGGLDVEGLGTVFLQAGAVGRPVLAGDSGGAPDTVLDGRTGHVVDGGQVEAVADGLLRLLDDPRRSREMGEDAAARIHRELTWPQLAARLARLLRDVATDGAPASESETATGRGLDGEGDTSGPPDMARA